MCPNQNTPILPNKNQYITCYRIIAIGDMYKKCGHHVCVRASTMLSFCAPLEAWSVDKEKRNLRIPTNC